MKHTKEQWSTLCDEALQELREGKHAPEVISLFNPTSDDEKTKIKIAYAIALLESNPAIVGWMLLPRLVDVVKNTHLNEKFTEDFDKREN